MPMITSIPNKGRLMLAMGILASIAFLFWWTYNQGYKAGQSAVQEKIIMKNQESRTNADKVELQERGLDYNNLVIGLCDLGIVRQNRGCE